MIDGFDKRKFLARLLIGIALLYFFVGLNFDLNIYDEGVGLVGAERVANGDIPYLDFFTIYAPFNYYLTVAYSMLFGASVMSPRFLVLIMFVITLAIMHRIIQKSNNNKPMFASGLVLMILLFFNPFYAYAKPTAPAIMFSVLALLFTINQIYEEVFIWKDDDSEPDKKPKPLMKYLVLSGVMSGFVLITRHFIGVYLLIAIASAVFFTFDIPNKQKIKAYLIVLSSASIIAIPVAVYFLINVSWDLLYNQLFYIPATVFPAYRALPWPTISNALAADTLRQQLMLLWLSVYSFLPVTVFLFTTGAFIKAKRNNQLTPRLKAALPISVFALLLIMQAGVRSDAEHFIPTWLFSLLALFVQVDFSKLRIVYKVFFVSLILGFIIVPLKEKADIIKNMRNPKAVVIKDIPRAERFIISEHWYKDLSPAVNFIRKHTSRKERIFVSPVRNDMLFISDAVFYFLAERLPGTRYHELHPGISTSEPVQKEIISDLKKNNVRYIVIFKSYFNSNEPNLSSKSSGVTLLDNFIKSNYSAVKHYGHYKIMKRN